MAVTESANAVIRAITMKAGVAAADVLLSDACSIDWQSLTFAGTRHNITLTMPATAAERLSGIKGAEFILPGHVLADIAIRSTEPRPDGRTTMHIEALTIEDN
jgi:hypothetical protein